MSLLQNLVRRIAVPAIRHAHTDITVPDWTPYRRSHPASERDIVPYIVAGTGLTISAYAVKAELIRYAMTMAPSAEVLALAKIEIKLADIPEGRTKIYKWRGKPLFVKHRTAVEIERERNVDISTLRDPEADEDRVVKPEWLVVIGVCTHLGCVPTPDAGDWPGGSYCPCHGSHYDGAGRIRKGPAPKNMEVPAHVFQDEGTILVG